MKIWAVILAAGIGKRLRPLTNEIPKILLPLNNCRVLDIIVTNVASLGIKKILFVTGHGEERLIDAVERAYWRRGLVEVRYVRNSDYTKTNTAMSLYLALRSLSASDDIVVINGDVVFDRRILKGLLLTSRSAIVVDKDKKLTEESFKVKIENGKIVDMGKHISIRSATGEYIGISRISKADYSDAIIYLKEMLEKDPNAYYDLVFKELSLKKGGTEIVYTNGFLWTEIDFPQDYEYAKQIVHKIEKEAKC